MAHYQNDEGAGEIVSTIESNGGQALAAPMSPVMSTFAISGLFLLLKEF
ncbi:hypothetical protein SAMN05443144_113142 [Fodinibius roseus]|uniref:Uncharacterized protein n=1 Tax=Fodinibius roseus TaxID=1194090 RepID=A0A1M5ERE8_9BACT|nr:hypothetical protein [Fodinibius roseus]SHF81799.1 hypothetical protein SAMN05443144_113142 [Fodinibius roseus]